MNPNSIHYRLINCEVYIPYSLCDGLITRPEESYGLWCDVVCDQETSRMKRPWPAMVRSAIGGEKNIPYNMRVLIHFAHLAGYPPQRSEAEL